MRTDIYILGDCDSPIDRQATIWSLFYTSFSTNFSSFSLPSLSLFQRSARTLTPTCQSKLQCAGLQRVKITDFNKETFVIKAEGYIQINYFYDHSLCDQFQ